MKELYRKKIAVIINLCSPYDQLFSTYINNLNMEYENIKLYILTDNKFLKKRYSNLNIIYCKKKGIFPISNENFDELSKIAIKYDRYCTYFQDTLYLPKIINVLFHSATLEALSILKKYLILIYKETNKIIFISEPPASAIAIYCDLFLREKNIKPYYFTSSRIFPGKSIVTQSNNGDAGAINIYQDQSNNYLNIEKNDKIEKLTNITNRTIIDKIKKYLKGNKGATSIYPIWLFRIFLVWRHFIYFSRFLIGKILFNKYTITETRIKFPQKQVVTVFIHFEPEVSTLYWMRNKSNQISWIEKIIKKENNKIFLIREHIHFRGYRPLSDYYKLLAYGNVLLAANEDVPYVIKNSDEILSYSGTIGYECAKYDSFKKFRYGGYPFYIDLIDKTGKNISAARYSEYCNKAFYFESDPAMPNFNTAQNKQSFVRLIKKIIAFEKFQYQ